MIRSRQPSGNRQPTRAKQKTTTKQTTNPVDIEQVTDINEEEVPDIDVIKPVDIQQVTDIDEEEVPDIDVIKPVDIQQVTDIDEEEVVGDDNELEETADEVEDQPLKNQPKTLGRMVLVTGDKGGTGKSVFARILLDIYHHRNIKYIAYECDQSNPQLYRHYHQLGTGVQTLKLNQRGGADPLQDNLKQFSPRVSLVDLPAGAAEYFEKLSKDIFLFENTQRLGYRITMVSVLSRVKDSLEQLKRLVDFCQDRVDYVIVKNLYWGDEEKFTRYHNSSIRQTLLELGAVELALPELFDDIFDVIDANDLTFREALEDEIFTLSNQSRIFGWINACENEFAKAAVQLGLD